MITRYRMIRDDGSKVLAVKGSSLSGLKSMMRGYNKNPQNPNKILRIEAVKAHIKRKQSSNNGISDWIRKEIQI